MLTFCIVRHILTRSRVIFNSGSYIATKLTILAKVKLQKCEWCFIVWYLLYILGILPSDSHFHCLAAVFRSFLVHGTVSRQLLICAFLPLLKSSLKDPASTGSYCAIASSSQILQLFDYVTLLLWGHHLPSDTLQFGYKSQTSTTQCSWLVMEVAQHYRRHGSTPILTLLDCSRAFDLCRFDLLFDQNVFSGGSTDCHSSANLCLRGASCVCELGWRSVVFVPNS